MPEDELLPAVIYDELIDKARRAGTAVPDGYHGDDPAMAWLPARLTGAAEALAPVLADVTVPARTFEHDDGSRYERVPPNDFEAA